MDVLRPHVGRRSPARSAKWDQLALLIGILLASCCLIKAMPSKQPAGTHMVAPTSMSIASPSEVYATKKIQDIRVGDWVLAKDPEEPGPPRPHRVVALPRNWTEHWVHIAVQGQAGHQGEVRATREHPFYTQNRGWVHAKDLNPGDHLVDTNGQLVLVASRWIEDCVDDTYNLTVEGVHTYYVMAGLSPVLVHNVSPWQHGDYNVLQGQSTTGDGLALHHYPQGQPASELIPGYNYPTELTVAVPTEEHLKMNGTNYKAGEFSGDMRQLIDEAYYNMLRTNIPGDKLNELDAAARKRYLPPCE